MDPRHGVSALAGVRVTSMALNVPGPVAVARLAAEGARIVKIEPPQGDPLAAMAPEWYRDLHAGVDVRSLDLKSADGRAAMGRLLADTDVFVTSQRPAALGRLGLDAAALSREHPALRVLAIVGDTSSPDDAGHDLTYQARAGLLGGELPRTLVADLVGAGRAVEAALLLLREPPGSRREVGLRDALDALTAPLRYGLTTRGGPLGGGNPAYAIYEAADGWVAVAALEPHFRARLYERLGLAEGSALTDAFRARPIGHWKRWAAEHDIPLAAIATEPGVRRRT